MNTCPSQADEGYHPAQTGGVHIEMMEERGVFVDHSSINPVGDSISAVTGKSFPQT
jgi:hypothetical protein